MAKTKSRQKKSTKKARRMRWKRSQVLDELKESPTKTSQQDSGPNPHASEPENTRIVIDIRSMQSMISDVQSHSAHCSGQIFVRNNDWKFLKMECGKCGYNEDIAKDLEEAHEVNINESLVVGAYCSGTGYSGLRSIFSALEIPFIHPQMFMKAENVLGTKLQGIMDQEFRRVAELERKLAEEDGRLIQIEGKFYPTLTKLLRFYMNDMAPEIVDPLFSKFQKFRVPVYRQKAIEERKITSKKGASQSVVKASLEGQN